ncbi:hypothetical protein PHYPSEUDO_004084 [Phytophthora pseudosyringae]|uniref:Tyrosinase copper-binding domain-containing protein n=1 Tax=Phytophthora pseudosyringae TaxID=221518 RepID=A0A8T1VQ16_9STRA|nr:hypothetical protein PHYPSEUDO_004084 [Phytophthora pseudosyringae]
MGRSVFVPWLVIAFVCFTLSSVDGQQVGTECTELRIRKSWDMYNTSEKALYMDAVGLAMDKGYHLKFIQIHTDALSGNEAHQNCMFVYWHRMLLLGYENMLRSLGAKYQCVTIPYWDHLSATARRAAGTCTGLQSCTPYLVESGGTTTGVSKSLNIDGTSIATSTTTLCINQSPLSHFCANNTACAQCVIRKRSSYMSSTAYPAEASSAQVYGQVFSYNVSSSFTNAVERGVHNTIHNALGGVMAYFQAPADPIFYSHHGLVDLLQTIYLKCQVGAGNVFLSASDKRSDPRWYSICNRKNNGALYTADDNITMRATGYSGSPVNVWQDPKNILYPFFKDLPYKYVDYIDAKDLGNYSYTYQISGGLANMYQNCWTSNSITSAANTTTTSTALLSEESAHGRTADAHLEPIIKPGTTSDEKMKRWNIALYEAARIIGYEERGAREQMEMVMCQYQEDCLGGVTDFTELYKANFGIEGHTRCYTVMQSLKAGDLVIGIPQWKDITNRFLPCSAYKKKTQTSVSDFAKAVVGLKTALDTSEKSYATSS